MPETRPKPSLQQQWALNNDSCLLTRHVLALPTHHTAHPPSPAHSTNRFAAVFHNFRVLGAYAIVWLPRLCPQHAPGLSSGHHWYNTILWLAQNNLSLRFPRWWVQPACILIHGHQQIYRYIRRMGMRIRRKLNESISIFPLSLLATSSMQTM